MGLQASGARTFPYFPFTYLMHLCHLCFGDQEFHERMTGVLNHVPENGKGAVRMKFCVCLVHNTESLRLFFTT